MAHAQSFDDTPTFENCQHLVKEIVGFLARKFALAVEEREDFQSEVTIKLLENDQDVFKKFKGKASVKTYLQVVISRHYFDYRDKAWGKWRPSEMAKRLGSTAILLEQYTHRDGYGFQQAFQQLVHHHGLEISESDLYQLFEQLPNRDKRITLGEESLQTQASADPQPDDALRQDEEKVALNKALVVLQGTLPALDLEDRTILRLHFSQNLPLSKISRALCLDQKGLYRRVGKILDHLGGILKEHGIDKSHIESLLR